MIALGAENGATAGVGRANVTRSRTRPAAGGAPGLSLGILSTFSIVRGQDEAQFGTYRTRDLILTYMNTLAVTLVPAEKLIYW